MNVVYTDYAEIKIQKREIDKHAIENALKSPDKILDGKDGRKIAHKASGKYILRVVFEIDGTIYKVITAYYSHSERYG